jgi:hypothetical protein
MFNHIKLPFLKMKWRPILLSLGIILVIIMAAFFIANSQEYFRANGSDFFSLWLAPHFLLEGKDPYSQDEWVPAHALYGAKWVSDSTFLYPLPLAIILIPLGFLPLEYAAVLWIAMAILAIVIACLGILSDWNIRFSYTFIIPIILGVFLFRSIAESLRLGQIDWMILLCLFIGLYFWNKQRWFAGGMIMGLTVLKPQLGVPLLLFLSLWLILRKLWSGLIGEGVIVLGLFAGGWIVNHSWLWQWLDIGMNKTTNNYCCTPTLWGLASLSCKFGINCGFTLGMVFVIILSIIFSVILIPMSTTDAKFVIGLSIPVALLVSPYLWVYSQSILIIPILMITGILAKRNLPYILVATFPLVMALFASALVYLSIRVGVDVLTSIVPLSIFCILLFLYRLYHKERELNA